MIKVRVLKRVRMIKREERDMKEGENNGEIRRERITQREGERGRITRREGE